VASAVGQFVWVRRQGYNSRGVSEGTTYYSALCEDGNVEIIGDNPGSVVCGNVAVPDMFD
jgi:hypothetical protein